MAGSSPAMTQWDTETAMFALTPEETTAILLSLKVASVAMAGSLPFGIAVAWLLARRNFPGKALVDAAVPLPLILPPVVTGYALLLQIGRASGGERGGPYVYIPG